MMAEQYTGRQLLTATYDYYLDSFEGEMLLPISPTQSVTSIYYVNASGVNTLLSTSNYRTDLISEPARITLAYGYTWPTIRNVTNAVKITFTAGYTTTANIPKPIIQAMYLMLGHWYENREDVIAGHSVNELPKGSEYLLNPYRLWRF